LGPEAHVESVSAEFRSLWDKLNIRFDHYVRTSADAKHRALVQEVVGRVKERGDIYKAAYTGLYCVGCEEFKQEATLRMMACARCIRRSARNAVRKTTSSA
jgi:methionyl-tRNA synthetase